MEEFLKNHTLPLQEKINDWDFADVCLNQNLFLALSSDHSCHESITLSVRRFQNKLQKKQQLISRLFLSSRWMSASNVYHCSNFNCLRVGFNLFLKNYSLQIQKLSSNSYGSNYPPENEHDCLENPTMNESMYFDREPDAIWETRRSLPTVETNTNPEAICILFRWSARKQALTESFSYVLLSRISRDFLASHHESLRKNNKKT